MVDKPKTLPDIQEKDRWAMKILVTGGAGFIGSHVVRAYLAAGHQVVVLDNLLSGRKENVPGGARLEVRDVRDPQVAEFMAREGFTVVNHHAAQISVPASVEDPIHDAKVNVVGLLNLLEAGRKNHIQRFIFSSSGGAIYGELKSLPAREDLRPAPMSPYAVAKRAAELYLDYYAHQFGLKSVTLRYANVYGPRQIPQGEAGVVAIFMDALMTQKEPVIYRQADMPRGMLRDYVFAADCARANLLALEHGRGIYNIGTGVPTDTLSLWEAVQKAAGAGLSHHFGPARPGDVRQSALDCAKAAQELGWQPEYDLARGLAETWSWRVGV
jgi:UDP-glucose 4-epimerase